MSQGKDLACRCPWYEGDETPICIVTAKSNLWRTFLRDEKLIEHRR